MGLVGNPLCGRSAGGIISLWQGHEDAGASGGLASTNEPQKILPGVNIRIGFEVHFAIDGHGVKKLGGMKRLRRRDYTRPHECPTRHFQLTGIK